MTASQRRTVMVLVAALGVAFLMVWASSVGPARVVAGQHPGTFTGHPLSTAHSGEDASQERGRHDRSGDTRFPGSLATWVRDLAAFALMVAGLLALAAIAHAVVVRALRGLPDRPHAVPREPPPDLDRARTALEESAPRQRAALASSDVRNGIVAAWVLFEEAATEAHVPRLPSETTSAFVVRFLHLLDVDPRPVGDLAQVFLEARFSTHELFQEARTRAEDALDAIHRDLARAEAAS